jgi:competence protein ComEC
MALAANLLVHELAVLPSLVSCLALVAPICVSLWISCTRPLAWFGLSFVWTVLAAHWQLSERLPAAFEGRDIAVTGWVDDFPTVDDERAIFSLRVDEAEHGLRLDRLRLSWYDDHPSIEPGARLRLVARLRQPRGLRNPGGFDYERWLFLEGFSATGYVRRGNVDLQGPIDLPAIWVAARAEIARRIAAVGSSPGAAALVTALSIGERSGFTDRDWQAFRRTGTSHLVAISGLHIGLVASFCFLLTRGLARRAGSRTAARDLELAAAVAALSALSYAALAGFSLPTVRALIMLVFALIVLSSRRFTRRAGGMAAALLLVLAVDPFAPLTASFWLSFVAVGVLLTLAPRSRGARVDARGIMRVARAFRSLFRLQWHVTLALVPLALIFFREVSVVGIAVNMVAIPLFSFVLVPATLLSTAAISVSPAWEIGLAGVLELADWTLQLLHWAAGSSFAAARLPEPDRWAILLSLAGVGLALPWHRCPGRLLCWAVLLPLLFPSAARRGRDGLRLLALDVGHGLAVIVETPRHRLLYDAGPVSRSGFNTGSEIVVPALSMNRGLDLDVLIVSHADNDHAGGAAAVLEAYPNARVLHGPDVMGLAGRTCMAGQRWSWDGVEFSIVHPAPEFVGRGNESSCVLKVSSPSGSVLIAGDIEARAERALREHEDLQVDAVVVPHHGSATSSSPGFVAQTRPSLALVSAGYKNRWGFPVPVVAERWRAAGAELMVTGDEGAIRVVWTEDGLSRSSERQRHKRYWHARADVDPGA